MKTLASQQHAVSAEPNEKQQQKPKIKR